MAKKLTKLLTSTLSLLNRAAGYNSVESLSNRVRLHEDTYRTARDSLSNLARRLFSLSTQHQSVNKSLYSLLQRKDTWGRQDVETFTNLYSKEHELAGKIRELEDEKVATEERVGQLHEMVVDSIRERYHMEMVWSERGRWWATFIAIGAAVVNLCVFLSIHLIVEPRRKKRNDEIVSGLDSIHRTLENADSGVDRLNEGESGCVAESGTLVESIASLEERINQQQIQQKTFYVASAVVAALLLLINLRQ